MELLLIVSVLAVGGAAKPQGAILFPTWSPEDAAVATSDQVAVPARPNSVTLPRYIIEKDAPARNVRLKMLDKLSVPPRKSPFMLLRMTEKKILRSGNGDPITDKSVSL
jgi:hypothetical protein